MKKLTMMICGAALAAAFAGCGGGGGGSSSAPPASNGSNGGTVEGIATPSSVSVVTAQNANTGG